MKKHWKTLTNAKYIGAYMVEKDLKVKIVSVAEQEIQGEGGRLDVCIVAELENQKPFIINKTNAKEISKIANSPYIEDWEGIEIVLFATTTKLKGDIVEC